MSATWSRRSRCRRHWRRWTYYSLENTCAFGTGGRRNCSIPFWIKEVSGIIPIADPGPRTPVEVLIWRRGDTDAEVACQALIPAPKAPAAAGSVQAFGLSLEQAPPIDVPLRFMLTAPLFGLLAAIALLVGGPAVLTTRWQPLLLAATHLITLGFMSMVMLGALMQMLPVLAGSPVPRARLISRSVHALLTAGILILAGGFITHVHGLFVVAVPVLVAALLIFSGAVGLALSRAPVANVTVRVMRLAVAGLIVTTGLGALLGWRHGSPASPVLTDLHLVWGLIGWAAILIVGVAYQVVPMFQITPVYPVWFRRWLVPTLFVALLFWSVASWVPPVASTDASLWLLAPSFLLMSMIAAFAIMTLFLQFKRRRRLPDVTLRFWQLGMVSLLACAGLWLGARFWPALARLPAYELLLGLWMIVGFTLSVINGMLYKIVPFLVWLHLQAHGSARGKLPNMKQVIPDTLSRRQLWLHGAALVALTAAIIRPGWLLYPAALLFAASSSLLAWNLARGYRLYHRLVRVSLSLF